MKKDGKGELKKKVGNKNECEMLGFVKEIGKN